MCITLQCCLTLRDIQKVLREDKERLRQMQKSQPHFSSDQRRELVEEHPWMRRGGLPAAINVKVRTTNSGILKVQRLSILTSDVCVFRTVYTVRMQQQLPLKRTCLIWTWASWERR